MGPPEKKKGRPVFRTATWWLLDGLLLFAVGMNPTVDKVGNLLHEGELVDNDDYFSR
jgi:hypothetical protein